MFIILNRLKNEKDLNPKFEISAYQKFKEKSLDTFEESANELKPCYFGELFTKIFDNLQVIVPY